MRRTKDLWRSPQEKSIKQVFFCFVLLTRLLCKALGKPHHSQRRRVRMDRSDECKTEGGDKALRSSVRLSAAVFLVSVEHILQIVFLMPSHCVTHLSSHLTFCLCSYLNTETKEKIILHWVLEIRDQNFLVLTAKISLYF